ncbi:MAG: ATP-binding cassette domain-containing protein [Eubacteriales bacterium]
MEDLKIDNLSFYYPDGTKAVSSLNAKLSGGSFTLICGKSGSGKTTLLRNLKKEIAPTGKRTGEVFIGGKSLDSISFKESAEKIGFVRQNPEEQIVTDSVKNELAFGLENLGFKSEIIRRRVSEVSSFFGIDSWFEKDTFSLSDGQKQILNLASAVVMQPEILVLDEPTAYLDPIASKEFLQVLKRINLELGMTVILSEHDLEDVLLMADNVLFMEEGGQRFFGSARGFISYILNEKDDFYAALPAASKIAHILNSDEFPISVCEGRGMLARHAMADKNVIKDIPRIKQEKKQPLISAKNVWFRYDRDLNFALKGLNIDIYENEILSVVGGMGSGKTTALNLLCQVFKQQRGSVKKRKDLKVALLTSNLKSFFMCDTLKEDLFKAAGDEDKTKSLVKRFCLTHLLGKNPYDLSDGELMRAAIVKILLHEVDVLMLDEPTKGIDAFSKINLRDILKEFCKKGKAVVIVTHDLEFAAECADRCAMMFLGEIICSSETKEFFAGNNFYTTQVNRITRGILDNCVTIKDFLEYV